MASAQDLHLPPVYWDQLSQDDRNEYMRLRSNFHNGQKISSKDRRIVTFRKELLIVLNYLESSQENMEARCVLTGVCFAGPLICVNTRQLKSFLSRCKSSINGSFQQLGFVALRTKAKAKSCVIHVLPSLENQQNILRQWTVRYTSYDALFCFVSSYPYGVLPEITEDDLFDDKKPNQIIQQQMQQNQAQQQQQLSQIHQMSQFQQISQLQIQQIQQLQQQNPQFQQQNQQFQQQQQQQMQQNSKQNPILQQTKHQISKQGGQNQNHIYHPFRSKVHAPLQPRALEFDLPSFNEFMQTNDENANCSPSSLLSSFKTSFSMDFKNFENDTEEWGMEESPMIADDKLFEHGGGGGGLGGSLMMRRSQSAQVEWNFFDDDVFDFHL